MKGGRGVGPVELKRKKGVRGEGRGKEQEPPKVRASQGVKRKVRKKAPRCSRRCFS